MLTVFFGAEVKERNLDFVELKTAASISNRTGGKIRVVTYSFSSW